MPAEETYRVTTWDMPACGPPEVIYEGPDRALAVRIWEKLPFNRRKFEVIAPDQGSPVDPYHPEWKPQ